MWFRVVARLLAIGAMLASSVALAAPAPHELRWTRADGAERCIEPAALIAAVEHRIGRPLGDGAAPVRTIDGHVEPTADGFRVVLVVRDPNGAALGERTLEEPGDCRRLDASLVLVLSLIVDSDALGVAPAPAPAPDSSAPPAELRRELPPPPAPRPSWRFAAVLSGVGALGALPGVAVGGDLVLDVDPPGLPPLLASFGAWLPDRASVTAGESRFTALGVGLLACAPLARAGELRACAGAEGVRVAATSTGFAVNRSTVDWIAYARLETEVVHPVTGRIGVVAGAGAWIAALRPRFVYMDASEVREIFAVPAIAAIVRLGVRVAL